MRHHRHDWWMFHYTINYIKKVNLAYELIFFPHLGISASIFTSLTSYIELTAGLK